jgi:hypothetical protein
VEIDSSKSRKVEGEYLKRLLGVNLAGVAPGAELGGSSK